MVVGRRSIFTPIKQHKLVLRNLFETDYPSFSSPRTYSESLYSYRKGNQDEFVLDENAVHNINVRHKYVNDISGRRNLVKQA